MLQVIIEPKQPLTERIIEENCAQLGLKLTIKGSLKTMPANTHWHYKYGKQTGVLEVTLLNNNTQVILSVHTNRMGNWQHEMLKKLEAMLLR